MAPAALAAAAAALAAATCPADGFGGAGAGHHHHYVPLPLPEVSPTPGADFVGSNLICTDPADFTVDPGPVVAVYYDHTCAGFYADRRRLHGPHGLGYTTRCPGGDEPLRRHLSGVAGLQFPNSNLGAAQDMCVTLSEAAARLGSFPDFVGEVCDPSTFGGARTAIWATASHPCTCLVFGKTVEEVEKALGRNRRDEFIVDDLRSIDIDQAGKDRFEAIYDGDDDVYAEDTSYYSRDPADPIGLDSMNKMLGGNICAKTLDMAEKVVNWEFDPEADLDSILEGDPALFEDLEAVVVELSADDDVAYVKAFAAIMTIFDRLFSMPEFMCALSLLVGYSSDNFGDVLLGSERRHLTGAPQDVLYDIFNATDLGVSGEITAEDIAAITENLWKYPFGSEGFQGTLNEDGLERFYGSIDLPLIGIFTSGLHRLGGAHVICCSGETQESLYQGLVETCASKLQTWENVAVAANLAGETVANLDL